MHHSKAEKIIIFLINCQEGMSMLIVNVNPEMTNKSREESFAILSATRTVTKIFIIFLVTRHN